MSEAAELWDWRRRIGDLYGEIRAADDPLVAWWRWRAVRDDLFTRHPQTPLEEDARGGFRGIPCFAYDPGLRFLVRLAPVGDSAVREFPAGEDGMIRMRPFAHTDGLQVALGGELTLYWIVAYGGGVFLPFADATSGKETYGAGRYLLDSVKGADLGAAADGRTVLDFNFAYHPSCAYSRHWVCPLAPADNRLPVAIRAGESGLSDR